MECFTQSSVDVILIEEMLGSVSKGELFRLKTSITGLRSFGLNSSDLKIGVRKRLRVWVAKVTEATLMRNKFSHA